MTDFGFNLLFGADSHKDMLLDFLNELLKEEQSGITELSCLKNEHIGAADGNFKAHCGYVDLYCTNKNLQIIDPVSSRIYKKYIR